MAVGQVEQLACRNHTIGQAMRDSVREKKTEKIKDQDPRSQPTASQEELQLLPYCAAWGKIAHHCPKWQCAPRVLHTGPSPPAPATPATLTPSTQSLSFISGSMTNSLATTRLFSPIRVGNCHLKHRVVHAPTLRCRSTVEFVATDMMLDYYLLRSVYPGTLIVFESTLVSAFSGLSPRKPGAFSERQQRALDKIFDEIHRNGSFVLIQLVAPGRVADVELMRQHGLPYLGPSPIYASEALRKKAQALGLELQELSVEQIHRIQDEFVESAVGCLRQKADIVEIHGTSGFLVEQFLSPLSNQRTDTYGGSIENRARFLLELVDRFCAHAEIGSQKTAVRLAPWSTHNGMNYEKYEKIEDHPALQMTEYLFREFQARKVKGDELAYVSIVEPRVSGSADVENWEQSKELNELLFPLFDGTVIRSGAYATNYKVETGGDGETGKLGGTVTDQIHYAQLIKDVEADDRTLIGLSRPFTSNPDLIFRLENGLELRKYERPYFYTHTKRGYLTYGKYDEELVFEEDELDQMGEALV